MASFHDVECNNALTGKMDMPFLTWLVGEVIRIMPYPGIDDALMLMAPDNKIQEAGQVGLPQAVLGALGV